VRIAYASYRNRKDAVKFAKFREGVNVSEEDVVSWLKQTPAILLIDELNGLDALNDQPKETLSRPISQFLKKYFLRSAGRYFIFSSHVVGTTDKLVKFMDDNANRDVTVLQLPLVCSVKEATESFGKSSISAADIVLVGNITALLQETSYRKNLFYFFWKVSSQENLVK
jgi:hypothetical protein